MFIYFDIGFTLMGGPSQGPARRLVEALGLPGSARSVLMDILFTHPFADAEQLADHIGGLFHTSDSLTRETVRQLWRAQIEEAYLLPGASTLLAQLQEQKIPFGFISNIWSPFYEGFRQLLPKESLCCPGFYSFQQGIAKPEPELYRRAVQQTGLSAEQVIMVGDTYTMDVAPARQLGLKTVWVLHRPHKELPELVAVVNGSLPKPDVTVASLESLSADHFRQWMAGQLNRE
ncbi:MAG: HAD family hydrolase [Magnetococcales bacterium]|nr:HAD family hydrolase [Magnetococcales bacterium]